MLRTKHGEETAEKTVGSTLFLLFSLEGLVKNYLPCVDLSSVVIRINLLKRGRPSCPGDEEAVGGIDLHL